MELDKQSLQCAREFLARVRERLKRIQVLA
jgi:hypothetical protein